MSTIQQMRLGPARANLKVNGSVCAIGTGAVRS